MPLDLSTDQGRKELMYRVLKCFEMKEVPLIVATKRDQETFVPWMAGLMGGSDRCIRLTSTGMTAVSVLTVDPVASTPTS